MSKFIPKSKVAAELTRQKSRPKPELEPLVWWPSDENRKALVTAKVAKLLDQALG